MGTILDLGLFPAEYSGSDASHLHLAEYEDTTYKMQLNPLRSPGGLDNYEDHVDPMIIGDIEFYHAQQGARITPGSGGEVTLSGNVDMKVEIKDGSDSPTKSTQTLAPYRIGIEVRKSDGVTVVLPLSWRIQFSRLKPDVTGGLNVDNSQGPIYDTNLSTNSKYVYWVTNLLNPEIGNQDGVPADGGLDVSATVNGQPVLPDGDYILCVEAQDIRGNKVRKCVDVDVANGGGGGGFQYLGARPACPSWDSASLAEEKFEHGVASDVSDIFAGRVGNEPAFLAAHRNVLPATVWRINEDGYHIIDPTFLEEISYEALTGPVSAPTIKIPEAAPYLEINPFEGGLTTFEPIIGLLAGETLGDIVGINCLSTDRYIVPENVFPTGGSRRYQVTTVAPQITSSSLSACEAFDFYEEGIGDSLSADRIEQKGTIHVGIEPFGEKELS